MRITRSLLRPLEKPNLTGFKMRDFLKASHQPKYDPWERNEAWRYTGHFSTFNRFKNGFPGLGIGAAAFAVYCAYEQFVLGDSHGHGHGHDHGHVNDNHHSSEVASVEKTQS